MAPDPFSYNSSKLLEVWQRLILRQENIRAKNLNIRLIYPPKLRIKQSR
jgi:hypothetical protein